MVAGRSLNLALNRVWIWCGLLLILSQQACFRTKTSFKIQLRVVNPEGRPIGDAEAFIDERIIGFTDRNGNLVHDIELYGNSEVKLRVQRQSAEFYYSPFQKTIRIEEAAQQFIKLDATLYVVAKPDKNVPPTLVVQEEKKEPEVTPEAPAASPDAVAQLPVPIAKVEPAVVDLTAVEVLPSAIRVPTVESSLVMMPGALSEPNHPKPNTMSINIYVNSLTGPISGAQVDISSTSVQSIRNGCKSNDRGRCVIRLGPENSDEIHLIVRAPGFLTQSRNFRPKDKGKEKFQLRPGRSLDVYASRRTYGAGEPILGAEVWMNGEKIGATDRHGHFGVALKSKPDELVSIKLRAKGHVPEEVEMDAFPTTSVLIRREFTASQIELPKVAIMPITIVDPSAATVSISGTSFAKQVGILLKKNLFKRKLWSQRSVVGIERLARSEGRSAADVVERGWRDSGSEPDAVVQPILIGGPSPVLELRVIDSKGDIIAGAFGSIVSGDDFASQDRQVTLVADRLLDVFPFESSVSSIKGDDVRFPLGNANAGLVRVGDRFEVAGYVRQPKGTDFQFQAKAIAQVIEVSASGSKAKIVQRNQTASIEPGDFARKLGFGISDQASEVGSSVFVQSKTDSAPISGATVYWNDRWMGSTSEGGSLSLPKNISSGTIVVVGPGYEFFRSVENFAGKGAVTVGLKPARTPLRIDSEPQGAVVFANGKKVGVTPVTTTVEVSSGADLSINIKGPPGYRDTLVQLKTPPNGVTWTDGRTVKLEKDLRGPVLKLIQNGDFEQALVRLKSIEPLHPDYLYAQNDIGDLLLTKLIRPEDAASAFENVVKSSNVANFSDVRFVGSHVNLGIALLLSGEKLLAEETERASQHFRRAIKVFEGAEPHLEKIGDPDQLVAIHNLYYYAAMAKYRVAELSKLSADQETAKLGWQKYLDVATAKPALTEGTKVMAENAKIFISKFEHVGTEPEAVAH